MIRLYPRTRSPTAPSSTLNTLPPLTIKKSKFQGKTVCQMPPADVGAENSFVKQTLTETLSAQSHSIVKSSATKDRKTLLKAKEMMSNRKIKAESEANEILKTLGLTSTPRKKESHLKKKVGLSRKKDVKSSSSSSATQSPSPSSKQEAVTDWEEIGNVSKEMDTLDQRNSSFMTPKPRPPLPSGPEDFLNSLSMNSISCKPSQNFAPESIYLARSNSLKSLESPNNLTRRLLETQKARDELAMKCSKLEHELNEVKSCKSIKIEGKVWGAKEFEELERQFDSQEKLLSGYQRENERSLIELEAAKTKMAKMGKLLAKVYGPDWEDTILTSIDGMPSSAITSSQTSAGSNLISHNNNSNIINPSTNLNVNPSTMPITTSEKLGAQLAQVQLLVQGMERRLVSREAELLDLQQKSKQDQEILQETISRIPSIDNDSLAL
ncbi:hypothetical protein O181_036762 [Austropuccinia psidii MF-1]|uniref:Uncharacterized protein n=1 Tax=Austropuccinia psidii MF-1 TaxID=1389203 RepID=A0A9Q3D7P2_9BASI|nr:hypothetical protein [Austropuccinia psidii MF-1]